MFAQLYLGEDASNLCPLVLSTAGQKFEAGFVAFVGPLTSHWYDAYLCPAVLRISISSLDLWFSSLMGMHALLLATLCERVAFEHTTRLLFSRGSGMLRSSSYRRRYGGIVGFDPRLHAFWRFHIKTRLHSHQDKRLGHAKVGWLLQLPLQASGGLWRQVCQHSPGLRQLVDALQKVPKRT